MFKRFLSAFLAMVLVLSLTVPTGVFAAEATNTAAPSAVADTDVAKIGDTGYATLAEAFTAAVDGDTIYLLTDVTQDAAITLSSARNLTLAVEEGKSATVSKSKGTIVLFDVKKGSLTLSGNLTLKGDMTGDTSTKSLVTVTGGAALTMNEGVTLRDNTANGAASSATSHAAGAVYMYGNATFTMNGGSIINCHNASSANTSTYSFGGGGAVRMMGNSKTTCQFIMNGGTISGCSANFGGAVGMSTNSATLVSFEMNGGTISGCSSTNKYGSAVAIYGTNSDKTVFTMNGGTITGNDCYQYGALSSVSTTASKSGRFYLLGGTISGNTRVNNSGFNNGTPGSEHGGHVTADGSFIIGGNVQILDEIGLGGKKITIKDDFTGTVYLYAGYGSANGTVVGTASGTASAEAAKHIVVTNGKFGDDGNYIRDDEGNIIPGYSVVVDGNNYVLGDYVEPATKYTVTYTDGVEGEEVFADQVYTVEEGKETPAFVGTPEREGYNFLGWEPAVAETVTADVTYVAQWEKMVVYVAQVESTGEKYETLQAALDAAKNLITAEGDHAGQTVTLIGDTTENVSVTFTKSLYVDYDFYLTIDLNGHTVTGLGTDSVMKFSEGGSGASQKHLYVTIKDTEGGGTVTGGNATSGGAIKVSGKSGTTLIIDGGTFTGNTATSSGGAIYSAVVGMNIIINGGTFSDNTAGCGGAIAAVDLTVNGGTFTNNTANGTAQYTGRGGAIYAYGTGVVELTINGGSFSGNTASRYGDDVLFGTTKKATVKLCDPSLLGTGFNAWAVDGYNGAVSGEAKLTDRYSPENAVVFEDYANYSATGNMVALKLAFVTPEFTVTYTDGVDGEEVFADVTYVVKEGEATPAFGQDPLRVGYLFAGWQPVVAETVTADVTYVAQWVEADGLAYIFKVGENGESINYTYREGGVGKIQYLTTDSYFYAYTQTAETGFGSFKAGVYYDITAVGENFIGWYIGDECISTETVLTKTILRSFAKLTDSSVVVEARFLGEDDPRTIIYTDGVEGLEIFPDQVYTAKPGEKTPAFVGTPTRPGCTFAGWAPEVSDTVTNNVTYVAQWDGVPPMPEKYCSNIENFETFVTVTCDTDHERHPDLQCKIYGGNNFKVTSVEPVWNEELQLWTVNATVSKFATFYEDAMYDTYNVFHDTLNEENYREIVLHWNAEKNLWVAAEPFVIHTTCQTAPVAPSYNQLDSLQIGVHGLVNGEEKNSYFYLPEGGYTLSEVKGSREEGFTVELTMNPLANGDQFITSWIEKHNPGFFYQYDWALTTNPVTVTLHYAGNLNSTLYGDGIGEWVMENGKYYGAMAHAYLKQDTCTVNLVIYRNGDFTKPYKTVSLGQINKGETLDLTGLDVADYYSSTYGFEWDGWFNDGLWNLYKAGQNVTGLEEVKINGWTNLICMVTDYQMVQVQIYKNGDTTKPFKTVALDPVLLGETMDLTGLNIADYYSSTYGFEYDGWFNDGKWNQYKAGQNVTGLDEIKINGWTNLIAMVYDYQKVQVFAVTNGDKDNAVKIFEGEGALYGENLVAWLNANVELTEKTGYTLDKWYNWDWYGHKYEDTRTVGGWTNVYVTYTANEYTVSFDPNGCPGTYESITVTYDSKYGTLPTAQTVPGIRNDGWFILGENGELIGGKKGILASTVVTTAGDHTLFQKRAIIPPNVKIVLTNDGEMGDTYKYYNGATRTLTVEFTANLNEEILSYSYQWYKNGVAIEGATEKVLVLDGNVSDTGTYKCAVTATLKDGVEIVVTEPSATREASVKVTIMRLANTYTYDFNGNGKDSTSSYTNGTSFTVTSTVPTRVGYTFAGWNTAADGTGDAYAAGDTVTFEGDKGNGGEKVTLYAQWTANTYTLTLDPNGGELENNTVTVTYDQAIGELPVPTKTGYTFIGWVDAEGNKVTAETVYTVADNSTLTATWESNSYKVTLDTQGGELEQDSIAAIFGEAIGELPVPTKTGYTFAGWVDAEGNVVTAETVYTVADNTTLTATWTANKYTVSFDANGGSDCESITVTFGETVGELPVPTKEGYIFEGWFDAEGNAVTAETVVEGDLVLTAKWKSEPVIPETGDSTPLGMLFLMILVSTAALAVLVSKKRYTA